MTSSSSQYSEDPAGTVDRSTQRLQSLINELSIEFISILDLDELIDRVAHRLREVIDFKFFNLLQFILKF